MSFVRDETFGKKGVPHFIMNQFYICRTLLYIFISFPTNTCFVASFYGLPRETCSSWTLNRNQEATHSHVCMWSLLPAARAKKTNEPEMQ